MTLREKILKTFIVTFREINLHGGPEEFFKKYPVGGIYYATADGPYDKNGGEMGTGATFERLEYVRKCCPYKMLICADGVRMPGQTIGTSQRALGTTTDPDAAYNFGKVIGMQFNSRGIDWVLQPSIDMYMSDLMPLMAISDDPKVIAKVYKDVVRGIQDQGVCATVKHFPGQGSNNDNMHFSPANNVLSFEDWMDTYGYTYKEMINEGVMSIMTTHTALKSYDNEFTDGYYPIATYSKKLTEGLLKGELGFNGAVVTDALIMGGMATGDYAKESAQAFKCGADVLLWPPMETADIIEDMINSGEIPMSRLDDALARIDKMIAFREKALQEKSYDTPDADFVNKENEKLVMGGMCLLKNDIGLIPISQDKHKNILIIDATENTSLDGADKGSSELLRKELASRGFNVKVDRKIFDEISLVCWQGDIDEVQKDYDLVIFNYNTNFLCSWNDPYILIWASHMFDKSKKLIINYGSPYFAPRYFPEDPTIIEVNSSPSEFITKKLVDGIVGEFEFTGKSAIKE